MDSVPVFQKNAELIEKVKIFRDNCEEKSDEQETLLKSWNEILDLIEKTAKVKFLPKDNWREMLWDMSGGRVSL